MTTGVHEEDSGLDCSADVGSAMAKEEIRSVPVRGSEDVGDAISLAVGGLMTKEEMKSVPVRGRFVSGTTSLLSPRSLQYILSITQTEEEKEPVFAEELDEDKVVVATEIPNIETEVGAVIDWAQVGPSQTTSPTVENEPEGALEGDAAVAAGEAEVACAEVASEVDTGTTAIVLGCIVMLLSTTLSPGRSGAAQEVFAVASSQNLPEQKRGTVITLGVSSANGVVVGLELVTAAAPMLLRPVAVMRGSSLVH